MNFRKTLSVNQQNHLQIGGFDVTDIVKKYGTPLYVIDGNYVKSVAEVFDKTIKQVYPLSKVCYASKALSNIALYKLIKKCGLSADVVSAGEIFTALKAGFNPEEMFFHGNNKLISELEYAINNGVGTIVVDNPVELDRIDEIAKRKGIIQNIIVRINPGVEAHTHSYVQTATVDSKFGSSIANGDAEEVMAKALKYKNIKLSGTHCHIGSQIFDKTAFKLAVEKVCAFLLNFKTKYDFDIQTVNFGGGFGIYYTDEDVKYSIDDYADYVRNIAEAFKKEVETKNLGKPYLVIEPGRAIVGEAGITLYTVGSIKEIKGVRKYLNVDGGMFENPRYALYNSKYSAVIANRAGDLSEETVTVAGKCCESGDILIKDIYLPNAKTGDILAVFSTGAYNYSMSSNYNSNFIPPMLMTFDGKIDYIIKPQTYEDLVRNNVVPKWLED